MSEKKLTYISTDNLMPHKDVGDVSELADIESDIDYCRKKIRSLKYSAIPIQEKSKKIQIYNEMLADLTCRKKMIEESEKNFLASLANNL